MTSLAGTEPPPHIHQNEDETFIIQEGEVRITIGDEVIDAKPGMVVFAPRIRHTFKIMTPTVRWTILFTPGAFSNFFREKSTETRQTGVIRTTHARTIQGACPILRAKLRREFPPKQPLKAAAAVAKNPNLKCRT